MISFISFSNHTKVNYDQTRHHPSVNEGLMDLDELDDSGVEGSNLTCPGEYLTSSQAYMRCETTAITEKSIISDYEAR